MSAEATFWAWKQPIANATTKVLLLCLAHYAGENHEAWPSVATICRDTGLAERTVRKHLEILEAFGFIERKERTRDNGSRTSNAIVIQVKTTCAKNTSLSNFEDGDGTPPGAPGAPPPCTTCTPPGAPGAPPEHTIKNLPKESIGRAVKPRPRDPIFDAIATVSGINLGEIHQGVGSMIAKAKQQISQSTPGVTTEEITARAEVYRRRWPKVTLTPSALAKHWPTLGAPKEESLLTYLP